MVGLDSGSLLGQAPPYPWWPKSGTRFRSTVVRGLGRLVPTIVSRVGPFTLPSEILNAERQLVRVSVKLDALVDAKEAPLGVVSWFTEERLLDRPLTGSSENPKTIERFEQSLGRILGDWEAAALAQTGVTSPISPDRLGLLSTREREILGVFSEGRDVPAIAKRCHISPHTVRNHLKSIYRKLHVHSQRELLLMTSGIGGTKERQKPELS